MGLKYQRNSFAISSRGYDYSKFSEITILIKNQNKILKKYFLKRKYSEFIFKNKGKFGTESLLQSLQEYINLINRRKMKNIGGVILGVAAAAAIGAAVGVAFAPDKGVVTRKKLKKKLNRAVVDLKDYVDEQKGHSMDKINSLVESGQEKVKELSNTLTKKAQA